MRGFTSLAERFSPDEVVTLLNTYPGTMAEIIIHHQGTIDEFIGDAILAIFGAPIQRPDDAERAVACALAMQLAMASVNEQNRLRGLPEVAMGIGLNTGEVVAGNIGSLKRAKYGVVGRQVNLTSRIESYTISGQVLISESTLQAVGSSLQVGSQMRVEPKGVKEPITIYEAVGIAGQYNVKLPEKNDVMRRLQREVRLRCSVVEDKHLGQSSFEGRLVKVSAQRGEVLSDHPMAPLSNLKVRLIAPNGQEVPGELYGKVLGQPADQDAGFHLFFTSISPELAPLFARVNGSAA